MKLSLYIFALLLLISNAFAVYALYFKTSQFIQKLQITDTAMQWFKWLPLLNIIGLVGILCLKKWAIVTILLAGILVIGCDIIFKINYHLPIAIISFAILCFLLYKNYHLFT